MSAGKTWRLEAASGRTLRPDGTFAATRLAAGAAGEGLSRNGSSSRLATERFKELQALRLKRMVARAIRDAASPIRNPVAVGFRSCVMVATPRREPARDAKLESGRPCRKTLAPAIAARERVRPAARWPWAGPLHRQRREDFPGD